MQFGQVQIDFGRKIWLPDDFAQGVKATDPISTGGCGTGGSYTVYLLLGAVKGPTFDQKGPTFRLCHSTQMQD